MKTPILVFAFLLIFFIGCRNNQPKAAGYSSTALASDTAYLKNLEKFMNSPRKNQQDSTLISADFFINGIGAGQDSTAIIKRLGNPDSVVTVRHPIDTGTFVTHWYYRDLSLIFSEPAYCMGIKLRTNKYSNLRGLVAGDSVSKMFRLYGHIECRMAEGSEDYDYADVENELKLIRVSCKKGIVQEIYLGMLFD